MIKIDFKKKDPEVLDVYIKMSLPISEVFEFLMKKGYDLKAFSYIEKAKEEFLLSEPAYQVNTFTATKDKIYRNKNDLYDIVFEKEIKELLNEI